MKDGTTHLAHKAEHAIDLGENAHGRINGAILSVNPCDATEGDTNLLVDTIVKATENLAAIKDNLRVADKIGEQFMRELLDDKGITRSC